MNVAKFNIERLLRQLIAACLFFISSVVNAQVPAGYVRVALEGFETYSASTSNAPATYPTTPTNYPCTNNTVPMVVGLTCGSPEIDGQYSIRTSTGGGAYNTYANPHGGSKVLAINFATSITAPYLFYQQQFTVTAGVSTVVDVWAIARGNNTIASDFSFEVIDGNGTTLLSRTAWNPAAFYPPASWTQMTSTAFVPTQGTVTVRIYSDSAGNDNGNDPVLDDISVYQASPKLTITKVTTGGFGGPFVFTGGNGWTSQSLSTTAAGSAGQAVGATQTLTTAGLATTISEAVPYNFQLTGISCTGMGSGGTATPTLGAAAGQGGSVAFNAAALTVGRNVQCTFTNQWLNVPPPNPKLTLIKSVVGGAAAATSWTLTASGPQTISGVTGDAAITSASIMAGTYTLSESAGPAGYSGSDYSCAKNGGVATSGNSITLTSGDTAICTVTNTSISRQVTLTKVWGPACGSDVVDSLTISGSGVSNPVPGSSTCGSTNTPATATATAGTKVAFSEVLNQFNANTYTANVTCKKVTDGTAVAVASDDTITMPADSGVACLITNAREQTVTLDKIWTKGLKDDAVDLAVTINTSTATGRSVVGGASSTAVRRYNNPGSTTVVTLSETFTAGGANYAAPTWLCRNLTTNNTTTTNTFNLSGNGDSYRCTVTNTRIAQPVRLAKTWVNGKANDTASATTTGGTNNATFTSTANGGATQTGSPGSAVTMYAGDVVTLPAETGTNIGNYTQRVYCTGGTILASAATPATLPQTITIAANTNPTTCTYVNTRISKQLTVAKTFAANSIVGDTATVNGLGASSPATTVASSSAITGTGTAVTVYVGDTGQLKETFSTGSLSSYDQTYSCTNPGATVDASGNVTIDAAGASNVTCTITNTIQSASTPGPGLTTMTCPAGSQLYKLGTAESDAQTTAKLTWDATTLGPKTYAFGDTGVTATLKVNSSAVAFHTGFPALYQLSAAGNDLVTWHDGGAAPGTTVSSLDISLNVPTVASTGSGPGLLVSVEDVDSADSASEYYREQVDVSTGGTWYFPTSGYTLSNNQLWRTSHNAPCDQSSTACNLQAGWPASSAATTRSVAFVARHGTARATTGQGIGYDNIHFCVASRANLSITKSNTYTATSPSDQASDTVVAGSTTTYTIVVRNGGPASADGAKVIDTPAAGLSSCSVTGTSVTNSAVAPTTPGNILTASGAIIPTLPKDGTVTFTVQCTVN